MLNVLMQVQDGREPSWLLILLIVAIALGLLALIVGYLPRLATWRRSFGDSLQAVLGRSSADAEAEYRAALIAKLQKHHLDGDEAPLDEIFVAPRLLVPQSGLFDDELLDSGPSTLHYLWPELAAGIGTVPPPSITVSELLSHGHRTLIAGEGGSGKTTLLAICAILCARSVLDERDTVPAGALPVFFHLGELETLAAEQQAGNKWSPDPMDPLLNLLDRGGLGWKGLDEVLVEAAKTGRLFLLIDGWDDLPTKGLGQTGIWLRDFLKEYSETRVLMSGPEHGYGPLMQLGFVISGLLRWRIGQAQELGRKWAELAGDGEAPAAANYWQPGNAALFSSLRLRHYLRDLVPGSRSAESRQVDLMHACTEDILKAGETGEDGLDSEAAELTFWPALAYKMLEEGAWNLTAGEVNELLASVLDSSPLNRGSAASKQQETSLRHSLKSSGLFVVGNTGVVRFLSPVWRDYMAALHVARHSMQSSIVAHMNERNWANVISFYMAMEGPESVLHSLSASGQKLNDVYQVASWLAELPGDEQWSQNVLIRLGRICMDTERPPTARQRAAAALAATGDPGVSALMSQVIRQFEPTMRQVALAVMARVSSSETVRVARRLFADSDAGVRSAAIHAIAWIDRPEADDALDETLYLQDQVLSLAAAQALALNGTEADYRSLRRAATSKSFSARRSSIVGLLLVDEPWADEFLARLEENKVAPVDGAGIRQPAKRLHRSQAGDQPWLVAWAVDQGRVVPVGQAAIPFLLEALQDGDATIRQRAATTLGQLASLDGTGPLRQALKDESPNVRQSAYVALAKIARAWATAG